MPMTPKQMIKLLKDNGFVEVRQNGSHKFFINKETNKSTVVPCHSKDLKKRKVRICRKLMRWLMTRLVLFYLI